MEGFLIHTAEEHLTNAMAVLRKSAVPIKLSATLCAVRTDVPGPALRDLIVAALPAKAHVLVARTNGAYVQGNELLASAARLLG